MTQIQDLPDPHANADANADAIINNINNIIDLVILHSNIPPNGIVDFEELGRLIAIEIRSNPEFDNNIQHLCVNGQDYISTIVFNQLNDLQKHVLCIAMATVCNQITINLINNGFCYPLYKVGERCFLDFLLERCDVEIDLLNNTLDFINDNFISCVAYIIFNNDYSLIRTLIYSSFHDNHDILLEKLANFNEFIQQIINLLNDETRQDFILLMNNNIQNITDIIFDTFLHIYVEIIPEETLNDYDDEHPRNSQRYETLLAVKNYLLSNGAIVENNFSERIIIELLNMYHNEQFENIEEYENYF
jgi:hypothetical protein